MAISPQRKAELDAIIVKQKMRKGLPLKEGTTKIDNNTFVKTTTTQPKTLLSKIGESLSKRGEEFKQTFSDVANKKINPLEGSLQYVGKGIGAVTDVAGQVGLAGIKAVTPDSIERSVIESKPFQLGAEKLGDVAKVYSLWASKNQRAAKDLESIVNIASILPIGSAAKATSIGATATKDAAGNIIKSTAEKVAAMPIASTVKTGTKATREALSEAGSMIKRGAGSVKEGIEKKALQAELPEPTRNLIRSGVSEDTMARVAQMSKENLPEIKKMAQIAQERTVNSISKARPLEVPGKILTDTASKLSKSLKSVGEQLGEVKKSLRGKVIDTSALQDAIAKEADSLRLSIKNGKILPTPGVPYDSDVLSVLNDVYKYINSDSDAEIMDLLRSTLNKQYTKLGTPFSDNATRLMTKYKDLALKAISETDPKYGALASKYSEQINALQDFTKLLNYKGSMENIGGQTLRAGEITRRLLGQASARPTEIIDNLLYQAKKAGVGAKDNFQELVRFADELDNIVGTTQTTGLQGSVQRAGEAVLSNSGLIGKLNQAAGNLIELGTPGAKEKVDALIKYIDSLK